MAKGFKEAAARSKPVYSTIMGSAPAEPVPSAPAAQEVHSAPGRGGVKQQRINMAFTPENLDYMRVMAGIKGISATRLVNDLIAKDRERNRDAYEQAKCLGEQL